MIKTKSQDRTFAVDEVLDAVCLVGGAFAMGTAFGFWAGIGTAFLALLFQPR